MKTPVPNDTDTLSSRLEKHPRLGARVERLFALCEDRSGALDQADDAEERVIEELRALGHEVLEDWAAGHVEARCQALDRTPGVWRDGKKNSAGIVSSGTSKSRSRSTGKAVDGDVR
jgi:hypothetical protein